MKNKKIVAIGFFFFMLAFVCVFLFWGGRFGGMKPSDTVVSEKDSEYSFGKIILNYDSSTPEIRERIERWYDENYVEYERLLGGPCKTFHLQVLHEDGGFINGGGGMFRLTNLERDTILRANGPLSGRNVEHVFSHELAHAFWNGIWPITQGINAGPSYINEGMAEYLAQVVIQKELKKGDTAYKQQWSFLPTVITSYDSYAVQSEATGKSLYWREQNNFNTNQALAVFAFLEETSPGFLKRFQSKICGLPPQRMDGGLAIVTSAEELEILMEDAFGTPLIEGKNFRTWLRNQPVSETNFKEGTAVRFHFLSKNAENENVIEGSSINPEQIAIAAMKRIPDQFGGYESSTDISFEIKITGWNGKIYFPEITDNAEGSGIDIGDLSLEPGGYKIEAREKRSGTRGQLFGRTFFIITAQKEKSDSEARHLYGLFVDSLGEIVRSGKVRMVQGGTEIKSDIKRGMFHFAVPQSERSSIISMGGQNREVFLSKWSEERFVIIQLQ